MTYQEDVDVAGDALERGEDANWKLAQLTYERTIDAGFVAPQREAGKVSMAQWCADVRARKGRRFSEWTGRAYRAIWEQAGRCVPSDQSWSEAYAEATKRNTNDEVLRNGTLDKQQQVIERREHVAQAQKELFALNGVP